MASFMYHLYLDEATYGKVPRPASINPANLCLVSIDQLCGLQ